MKENENFDKTITMVQSLMGSIGIDRVDQLDERLAIVPAANFMKLIKRYIRLKHVPESLYAVGLRFLVNRRQVGLMNNTINKLYTL